MSKSTLAKFGLIIMVLEKQFIIHTKNKARDMEKLFKTLKREDVNLRAVCFCGSPDAGMVKMIVDAHVRARKALKKARFSFQESKVIGLEVGDTPGALEFFIRRLVKDGITLNYAYGSIGTWGGPAFIVMHIDNPEAILERYRSEPTWFG